MTTTNHNTADQSGADERLQKIVDWLNGCGMHLLAQELQAALASTQSAPTAAQAPLMTLILGGIDGEEYAGNDVEWHHKAIEVIQDQLVKSDKEVYLPLYATPQPSAPVSPQASGDSHYSEEALTNELAAIRNLFPIPPQGSPLEESWAASMSDPMEVSGFVRKAIAAQTAKAVAGEAMLDKVLTILEGSRIDQSDMACCDSCSGLTYNDALSDVAKDVRSLKTAAPSQRAK